MALRYKSVATWIVAKPYHNLSSFYADMLKEFAQPRKDRQAHSAVRSIRQVLNVGFAYS